MADNTHNMSPEDIKYLVEAFESFQQVSKSLESAYLELQTRASKLDLELKLKNQELKANLAEREKMGNYLQSIIESIDIGLLAVDESGNIEYVNTSGKKLLDLSDKHSFESVFKVKIDEHIRNYIEMCLANINQTYSDTVIRSQRKDGEMVVLELGNNPVRDSDGNVLSTLILIKDISLMHKLKQQSLRTARLAAMGEMAAEIAHEIRNPLGSMKLFASMLEHDFKGSEQQKLASNIISGINSINNVVTNMLTFSRDMEITPEQVNLIEILEETFEFSSHSLNRTYIQLEKDFSKNEISVKGDGELLKQVFLNLFLNAADAMGEIGGTLTVRTRIHGDYCEVLVGDTGRGIKEEDINKIFDPFFTTSTGGTGLGLSVVNQIIEKHKGAITVESNLNKGTEFIVSLPIFKEHDI